MKKLMLALACLMAMGMASAKLPPLSDEAKAKAAEAKDKAAWSDKVAAYQLCMRQNQVADYYRKTKGAEAKPANAAPAVAANAAAPAVAPSTQPVAATASAAAPAPTASTPAAAPVIPPCQDPGPYAAAQVAAKVGVADSLPVPAAGKPAATGEVKK